jgi:hypothetical protein
MQFRMSKFQQKMIVYLPAICGRVATLTFRIHPKNKVDKITKHTKLIRHIALQN